EQAVPPRRVDVEIVYTRAGGIEIFTRVVALEGVEVDDASSGDAQDLPAIDIRHPAPVGCNGVFPDDLHRPLPAYGCRIVALPSSPPVFDAMSGQELKATIRSRSARSSTGTGCSGRI